MAPSSRALTLVGMTTQRDEPTEAERERIRAMGRRMQAIWESENGPITPEEWARARSERVAREARATRRRAEDVANDAGL